MFSKNIFKVLIPIFALVLAACSGAGAPVTPEPTTPPATEPAPTSLPSPTFVPAATNAPGCSVVSETFSPEPPADSPFPPVGEEDWAQGPANAAVTLVEYGDFQ